MTIEATATIDGMPYRSWASFRANAHGLLDLTTAVPLAGTYHAPDAMGLFWSMVPMRTLHYTPSSLEPIRVRLTLYEGQLSRTITLTRGRIAPGVARTPLSGQPISGTLFSPQSNAHGIVIVLGGSEGGADENRAAIIACHGFTTLALAYFGSQTLPTELANIPLEYIDKAITWFHAQPGLAGLPILLEGDSKGAELALLVAAHNPAIKGVVAFAPSSEVFEGFSTREGLQRPSWTFGGVPIPFANNPVAASVKAAIKAERSEKRPVSFRDQYAALATPPDPRTVIHVEDIHAPLLLVAGGDDQLWPSDIFAKRIMARRANAGYRDEMLVYPKAGHQIDVPYMPTAGLSVYDEGSFKLALGGTSEGYARADADMWPRVIKFLRRVAH